MSVLKKSGYGDGRTAMIVDHFATHVLDTLILPSYARSEVHEDKRTEQARANLWKLEAVCMHDHQRYFTFDVSELDGSDGLRGDTAQRDGIQKEIHDIQGAYEKYRKQQEADGIPVRSIQKWINKNNNQADALIYERATELGCDFLITKDKEIGKGVPATNSCKPITLPAFIAILANV